MAPTLFILAALSFLSGFMIYVAAASSVHQILGVCMYIVAAVTFSAGGIVHAVNRLRRAVERAGGAPAPNFIPGPGDMQMRCPECREIVLRDARKCKHCGSTLTPQ